MSKRLLKRKYADQYSEAKKEFLERTGKKIGKGFAKSPEYKKVRKRETQALWRFERKEELRTAKPIAGAESTEIPIEEGGLFWLSLYGNGSSTDSVPMGTFKEMQAVAKSEGKRLIGTVIYPDGIGQNYGSESEFRAAIAKLSKFLSKSQRQSGGYPVVDTTVIENENQIFVLVEANHDTK